MEGDRRQAGRMPEGGDVEQDEGLTPGVASASLLHQWASDRVAPWAWPSAASPCAWPLPQPDGNARKHISALTAGEPSYLGSVRGWPNDHRQPQSERRLRYPIPSALHPRLARNLHKMQWPQNA